MSTRANGLTLDHVGILVSDLDGALTRYGAILDGKAEIFADDEELDCRWARIALTGSPPIELVSPRSERSPYHRDLERRGEGLHHVSFRVSDIEVERRRLEALGLEVLGFSPDHSGWRELFLHPRETNAALLHFCVPPEAHR